MTALRPPTVQRRRRRAVSRPLHAQQYSGSGDAALTATNRRGSRQQLPPSASGSGIETPLLPISTAATTTRGAATKTASREPPNHVQQHSGSASAALTATTCVRSKQGLPSSATSAGVGHHCCVSWRPRPPHSAAATAASHEPPPPRSAAQQQRGRCCGCNSAHKEQTGAALQREQHADPRRRGC